MEPVITPTIQTIENTLPSDPKEYWLNRQTVYEAVEDCVNLVRNSVLAININSQNLQTFANEITDNENIMISNENERNSNELQRQQAEYERNEAEEDRQQTFTSNENYRKNEFNKNESKREETFTQNETNRKNTFEENELKRDATVNAQTIKIIQAYQLACEVVQQAEQIINGTKVKNTYGLMMTNYAIGENSPTSTVDYKIYFAEKDADFVTRYVALNEGMKIRIDASGGSDVDMKLYYVVGSKEAGDTDRNLHTGSIVRLCKQSRGFLEYNVILTGFYVLWLSDGEKYIINPVDEPTGTPVVHDPAASIVIEDKGLLSVYEAIQELEHTIQEAITQGGGSQGGPLMLNEFGDSTFNGLSQKFLTENITNLQGEVDSLTMNNLTLNFTANSPIFVGIPTQINLNASSNFTADYINISGGNLSLVSKLNVSSLSAVDTLNVSSSGTTTYTAEFKLKGNSRTKTVNVVAVDKIYYGGANSYTDLTNDSHSVGTPKVSPNGDYSVNVPTTGMKIYWIIPSTMTIHNALIDNNPIGKVPLHFSQATINGVSYKVYESDETIQAGTYNITVS